MGISCASELSKKMPLRLPLKHFGQWMTSIRRWTQVMDFTHMDGQAESPLGLTSYNAIIMDAASIRFDQRRMLCPITISTISQRASVTVKESPL
jgi:hypothetical protein